MIWESPDNSASAPGADRDGRRDRRATSWPSGSDHLQPVDSKVETDQT